jgi:hypothetical protein
MVDQLTIQTVGVIIAASSVVLYILNLFIAGQREEKNRKVATSINMLQILYKEETTRSMGELLNYTWTDFPDFLKRYDSSVNPDSFAKRSSSFMIYETLGYLLEQGLVDRELVYNNGGMAAIFMWAKFKPVIEEYRKIAYGADMDRYFEYFATEMWKIKKARDPSFSKDLTINLDFDKVFMK